MSAEELTPSQLADRWESFLKSYTQKKKKEIGNMIYYDMIGTIPSRGGSSVVVDYNHLVQAMQESIEYEVLEKYVIDSPDDARKTLAAGALTVLQEFDPEYANSVKSTFRAEFINIPEFREFHEITSEDFGKFRTVEGLVIEKDEDARTWFKKSVWRCVDDHKTTRYDSFDEPNKCSGIAEGEEPIACFNKSFTLDEKESVRDDYFELKIQQRPDKAKDSAITRQFVVKGRDLVRQIVNDIHFGDFVTVCCVVRAKVDKTNKSVANYVMELSSISKRPESALAEDDPTIMRLVEDTIDPEHEERDYKRLINSVAPSVWTPDSDILKEVILLLLVGADPKVRTDGTRIRGEHQGLIIGGPGTAKSSIAKWIMNTRPRVIYNSGANTSAVGLVGGMKQGEDKRWVVAAGAFGLAGKKGLVVIDEFARRPQEHFDALAEVMSDEQTITIAKGGYRKITQTDSGVLAISNPNTKTLRYDNRLDLYANTKVPPNILDRFDWIFVVRDVVDEFHDRNKYERYTKGYHTAVPEADLDARKDEFKRLDTEHYPVIFMRHWIQYVRTNFHPRVTDSPDVIEYIYKFFRRYRKLNIRIPKDDKEVLTKDDEIPAVDFRTLGAIFRLTEARARAGHRNEVKLDDAKVAIRIIEASIASTGFNPYGSATPDRDEKAWDKFEEREVDKIRKQVQRFERMFIKGLEKISWQRCETCRGAGSITDPVTNDIEPCDLCQAQGGERKDFDKSDLEAYCTGRGIPLPNFANLWKQHVALKEIIPVGAYFKYTMPHIDHYIEPTQEDLSESTLIKASIARTDPAIVKRLEEDEI